MDRWADLVDVSRLLARRRLSRNLDIRIACVLREVRICATRTGTYFHTHTSRIFVIGISACGGDYVTLSRG